MAWHNKQTGSYSRTSTEAYDNAIEVYNILSSWGWNRSSVCALLGNMEVESGYNPWRWQGDSVPVEGNSAYIGTNATTNTNHAYGLMQFDPPYKYLHSNASTLSQFGINYSNQAGSQSDGYAQLWWTHNLSVSTGQYFVNPSHPTYNDTWNEFITNSNNRSVTFLATEWCYNWERGTWSDERVNGANFWDQTLPGSPQPPAPSGNIPIWLLFKLKERNFK